MLHKATFMFGVVVITCCRGTSVFESSIPVTTSSAVSRQMNQALTFNAL